MPAEVSHPLRHGWLQLLDAVPMHLCLVSRRAAVALGPFDPSPVLQRRFWWDFTLRLSRVSESLVHVSQVPGARLRPRWQWTDFPFATPQPVTRDLSARAVFHGDGFRGDRWQAFKADLPVDTPGPGPGPWPIRVTLLSGLLDSHHNQIFFFNFFERLRGEGYLTWRALRYEDCREEDLAGCDLVVFSRPRYPEVPVLLDRCRALGRPVLAMIDDNWIAAGREFPQTAAIFTPGQPAFEAFRAAMRHADAVLVFSEPLEEDVLPLATRVLRLPPNIDLDRFAAPVGPRREGLLVGFAGSPRLEPAGFRGLALFLSRRPQARLLVMAHRIPPELTGLPAQRMVFVPWRHGYDGYARTLAGLRPDVLVAPLGASRFEASKIPTKFLEAAAVGAAGVYSRVAPYTEAVRDGETGLLAANDEEAWAAALDRLADDPGLRRRLAAAALREVRERFETGQVMPAFLAAILEVLAA